jgi:carboxynorspermidine decarboxylase
MFPKSYPTPIYVVDEEKLERNGKVFQKVVENTGCEVILALKAFSMYEAFNTLKPFLSGCTASSLNEAILAKEEFQKEVHLYAPAYKESEFKTLLDISSHITFNGIDQLKYYADKYNIQTSTIQIGLRLNPEYSSVKIPMYNPCQKYSRFGVTQKEFDSSVIPYLDGVHFHTLCGQGPDALRETLIRIESNFQNVLNHVKWVNFGGGHMLTRHTDLIDEFSEIISTFKKKHNVQVVLEPGEGVAYNAGYFITRVLDIIKNEKDIVICDASATAHMPDVLEMPYRPYICDSGNPGEKEYSYIIGGNSCLSGDIIGEYSFDKKLAIGDTLIFTDMAHYTMVKTTYFNGITHPAIARYTKDKELVLCKEFGYNDFKRQL